MIRKLAAFLLVAMSAFGCRSVIEQPFVTESNDTIPMQYLITESRVGPVLKGTTIQRLKSIYGEGQVKQLLTSETQTADTTDNVQTYYVYDDENRLLFIARANDRNGNNQSIDQITVKDNRFRTQKNIGANSTIGDVAAAYDDLSVVQYDGSGLAVFLPSVDGYLGVKSWQVSGFDPNFVTDIPIDSIAPDTRPQFLTVNWASQETNILSPKFWRDMARKLLTWTFTELPSILVLIGVFVVMLRMLKFLVKKVQNVAVNKVTRNEDIDTQEATKRIATISGIIHGVGRILLWTIFLLIFLSKININIGPILASAGIVGLAVGFGAQELVRDFISGFFMLLEDQLRTGDMAIINGTTGVVEKIELRTVTLRDSSGVVHIFQNGKINSLSNMTKEWSAIIIEVGVSYESDIDRVMELMRNVGNEMAATEAFGSMMLGSADVLGVEELADSAVVIKTVIKTRPMQQWTVKREYQRRIKLAFDKEGIEIPYPHISIYTGEATKAMPVRIDKAEGKAADHDNDNSKNGKA